MSLLFVALVAADAFVVAADVVAVVLLLLSLLFVVVVCCSCLLPPGQSELTLRLVFALHVQVFGPPPPPTKSGPTATSNIAKNRRY